MKNVKWKMKNGIPSPAPPCETLHLWETASKGGEIYHNRPRFLQDGKPLRGKDFYGQVCFVLFDYFGLKEASHFGVKGATFFRVKAASDFEAKQASKLVKELP